MTEQATTPAADHKAKKQRSPNFPSITLKDAITLAEKVYAAEKFNFAPVVVIVTKHWGFGEKSSAWKLRIAALSAFGLLDIEGDGDDKKARVSELAKRIILDRTPEATERKAAIKKAAVLPPLYKELRTKWGAELPSDATVQTYLLMDRGFTDDGATLALSIYKATIAFAGLDAPDSIGEPEGDDDADGLDDEEQAPARSGAAPAGAAKPRANPPPQSGMRELPITLPSLSVAMLSVPHPMTAVDFDFLKNTLEAYRIALTARPPEPPTTEGGAA